MEAIVDVQSHKKTPGGSKKEKVDSLGGFSGASSRGNSSSNSVY